MKNTIKEIIEETNKKEEIKKKFDEKEMGRYWACVVYPDSAPTNWVEILRDTGLEIAISPIHDKDINDVDETQKKAHWHIIIIYANTTTRRNIKSIVEPLNCPTPMKINSIKGAFRYLTHMDHPHKYQYNQDDIQLLNGFDKDSLISLSLTDQYKLKCEIISIIKKYAIRSYWDLLELTIFDLDKSDYYKVVMDNTILFNTAIKSFNEKFKTSNYTDF